MKVISQLEVLHTNEILFFNSSVGTALVKFYPLTPFKRETECLYTVGVSQNWKNLIRIILVRHTCYNEDDLEAPSSAINK
jgi:hypothetical protein